MVINEKNNEDLKTHIENLKKKLVDSFFSVKLPGK